MDIPTEFEKEPCGRCGGSGTYSFTPSWGTTCFSCGTKPHVPGSGRRYTKRGAAAVAYLRTLLERPAGELQPGMLLEWRPLSGSRFFVEIVKVAPSANPPVVDGKVCRDYLTIECRDKNGASYTRSCDAYTNVRIGHTAETKAQARARALAYQLCLTKAGKLRKRLPADLREAAGL